MNTRISGIAAGPARASALRLFLALLVIFLPLAHHHALPFDSESGWSVPADSSANAASVCPICALGDGATIVTIDPVNNPLSLIPQITLETAPPLVAFGHAGSLASRAPPTV